MGNAKQPKKEKADWEKALSAEAYDMKLKTGESIGHCFEAIAKAKGFNNYAAYRAHLKETANATRAR